MHITGEIFGKKVCISVLATPIHNVATSDMKRMLIHFNVYNFLHVFDVSICVS